MLRIRAEQVQRLAEAYRDRLERRLSAPTQPWFTPGEVPPREQRLTFVRGAVAKALEYGIVLDRDVERFVNLSRRFGGDFDLQPWAAGLLYRKPLDYPTSTVDHLVAQSAALDPGQTS